MNGVSSQAFERIRLFLLAVTCWLCLTPAAHAIHPPSLVEQLKEEPACQEPLAYWPGGGLDAEVCNGLFARDNPLHYVDPSGHAWALFDGEAWNQLAKDLLLGDSGAHHVDPNSAQALANAAGVGVTPLTGPDGKRISPGDAVWEVGKGVVTGALQGAAMMTGGEAEEGIQAGEQALKVGQAAEETTTETVPQGANILQNGARGRASEARVLKDMGLTKNTSTVSTAEGNAIPDALTGDSSIEIKDTKVVNRTKQIRIQTDAAKRAGKESVLVTGEKTQVSVPAQKSFDKVIPRPDLGPQQ